MTRDRTQRTQRRLLQRAVVRAAGDPRARSATPPRSGSRTQRRTRSTGSAGSAPSRASTRGSRRRGTYRSRPRRRGTRPASPPARLARSSVDAGRLRRARRGRGRRTLRVAGLSGRSVLSRARRPCSRRASRSACAIELLRAGVEVFERSPVLAIAGRERRRGRARRHGGTVRARAAVLATGGRAGRRTPRLRRRLTLTSSHMVITEPVPDVLEEIGWTGGECITRLAGDGPLLPHHARRADRLRLGRRPGGRAALAPTAGPRSIPRVARQVERAPAALLPRPRGPARRARLGRPDRRFADPPAGDRRARSRPGALPRSATPATGSGRRTWSAARSPRWRSTAATSTTRLAIVTPPPLHVPPEPFRYIGGTVIRDAILRKEEAWSAASAPARSPAARRRRSRSGSASTRPLSGAPRRRRPPSYDGAMADAARHRPPRHGRLLRLGRAAAAAGAARQAGDRRRRRTAGGGHDRVL